jgi:hypothetical protein
MESNTGSLIGVYGPFYSIKKKCYSIIPDYIILDDLYLSLRILKTKQIEIREDCKIIDESFSIHYNYKRTRRYLKGLLQLLKEKTIISDLSYKQRTMLIWHKYLRLLIPFFLILSYLCSGILIINDVRFAVVFGVLTIFGLLSVLPSIFKIQLRLSNLIRMNIFYFIAFTDIFINSILLKREIKSKD